MITISRRIAAVIAPANLWFGFMMRAFHCKVVP